MENNNTLIDLMLACKTNDDNKNLIKKIQIIEDNCIWEDGFNNKIHKEDFLMIKEKLKIKEYKEDFLRAERLHIDTSKKFDSKSSLAEIYASLLIQNTLINDRLRKLLGREKQFQENHL